MQYCLAGDHIEGLIAGTDEAGRGPLAGDVVAAAVILAPDSIPEGLNDSKKLSEKSREKLYELITNTALSWYVGRASVSEIDSLNILHASMLAMKRAVEGLATQPAFIYVDGNRLPAWQYHSKAVVKGDSRVAAIAAASILAKVTRDRELLDLDRLYPAYGFAAHKGYPTKAHLHALQQFGPSPVHRRTFGPVARQLTLNKQAKA